MVELVTADKGDFFDRARYDYKDRPGLFRAGPSTLDNAEDVISLCLIR